MNELACYSRATAEQNIICSQLFITSQRWGVFYANNIFFNSFLLPANYDHTIFCKTEKYSPILLTIVMHEENPVNIF